MTCHDRMAPEDFDLLAGTRTERPPRAGGDARTRPGPGSGPGGRARAPDPARRSLSLRERQPLAHRRGGAEHLHHRGTGGHHPVYRQARRPRADELRPHEGRGLQAHGAGPALPPVTSTPPAEEGPPCWPTCRCWRSSASTPRTSAGGALVVRQAPFDVDPGDIEDTLLEMGAGCSPPGGRTPPPPGTSCSTPWPARRPSRGAGAPVPRSWRRWREPSCGERSNTAPHGRPVAIELTRKDLEKQFRRA